MSDPAASIQAHGPRQVVMLRKRSGDPRGHQAISLDAMARRIAGLMGCVYAGEYAPSARYDGPLFFVPDCTLLDSEAALLGVRGSDDLFGGVVPFPFVSTKIVSHPALTPNSRVPEGWSYALGARLADAVLPGFSVFTADDALQACEVLFRNGPARLKPALGIGGGGQTVATCNADLDAALERIDPDELRRYGLAVEQNLDDAVTLSIGQAEIAGVQIGYYGTQRLTTNRNGEQIYGGSDLQVVRGGFTGLLALELPPGIRIALEQARHYDAAVSEAFPRFFASRRNYDIIQGRDHEGRHRSGVLEQSWRIGGASPAEIAAIKAFLADPRLSAVHASSHEVHALNAAPEDAEVYFNGDDPRVGPLTKFSRVQVDGNQA